MVITQDRKTVTDLEGFGQVTLPTALEIENTEVGSLLGRVFDAASGVYYALFDNRSNARFILRFAAKLEAGNASSSVQSLDADVLGADREGLSLYDGANGTG